VDFHMDFCLDLQCAAAISVANGDQGVLDRCPSQVLSGFEDFGSPNGFLNGFPCGFPTGFYLYFYERFFLQTSLTLSNMDSSWILAGIPHWSVRMIKDSKNEPKICHVIVFLTPKSWPFSEK